MTQPSTDSPRGLSPDDVLPLLQPFDARQMKATPVSTRVNSPNVDTPELILPLAA